MKATPNPAASGEATDKAQQQAAADGRTEQQGRPRGDDGYPSATARERELDEDVLTGMGIKSRGKGWR
jgi:hypothetical protein